MIEQCCPNCWMIEKELIKVRRQLAEARAQAAQATDLMMKGESLRSKMMLQAILGEFPPKKKS